VSLGVSMARIEGRNLVHLIDEFVELVTGPRPDADPALSRLAPAAYPDDDAASAEFRRGTRDELLDRRRQDALAMRADLTKFDGDDMSEPLELHEVAVPQSHIDPWMRTLASIRLVVASRLGIDEEDQHDADDGRFQIYDWLGFRLDDLIRLADEADAGGPAADTARE